MIKRKLVFLGAGGFGREVAWQVSQIQSLTAAYEVLGFVDDSPEPAGNEINGLPVLGDTQWLLSYPEELSVVICIGNSRIRKQVYERLSTNLIPLSSLTMSVIRIPLRLGKAVLFVCRVF